MLSPKLLPRERTLKAWAQMPLRFPFAIGLVMNEMHGPISRECQVKRPTERPWVPSSGSGPMFFWRVTCTPTWNFVSIWEQWLLWDCLKVSPFSAHSKFSPFNPWALHPMNWTFKTERKYMKQKCWKYCLDSWHFKYLLVWWWDYTQPGSLIP